MLNWETHQDWAQNSQIFQAKTTKSSPSTTTKERKKLTKSDWSCVLSLLNNLFDQRCSNLCDTEQKHTKTEVLQQTTEMTGRQVQRKLTTYEIIVKFTYNLNYNQNRQNSAVQNSNINQINKISQNEL